MAEYGLTLPDHDLTAQEFKELARRLGRAAFTPLFLRLYERVITSEATIEEQRKVLADISRWTGVEEDKKLDPNANLPVFNIVFGAPAAGAPSVEVVDVSPPAPPVPDAELPVFGSLAENAAFRDLAHHMLTPPEVPDAQLQASEPADEARADLAATLRALDAADSQDQPTGQLAPAAEELPRQAERRVRRVRGTATVSEALPLRAAPAAQAPASAVQETPEGVARSHDTLMDALNTLDSALDGI
jgi:hypothetical protein